MKWRRSEPFAPRGWRPTVAIVALVLAAVAVTTALLRILPLPPREVVLFAGPSSGGYAALAEAYRHELNHHGIVVTLDYGRPGGPATLQQLADPNGTAVAGFVNGLQAERGPEVPVQAIAKVGREPLWIFVRRADTTQLGQLRGSRIAAGPRGGAAREIAGLLLAQSKLAEADLVWQDAAGAEAADLLLTQQVDAVFGFDTAEAPWVRRLVREPGIFLIGVDRANMLAQREPRLSALPLPEGAIEMRGGVPARDLTLLSTATQLVVRPSMHPALQRAFLDAAVEVHSQPSLLQRQMEYPSASTDFPLSSTAHRHLSGQRPWMERVLPYGLAQRAELFLYGLLPMLLAAVILMQWIPRLVSLRVDARLAHYYGELKFMEDEMGAVAAGKPIEVRRLLARLDTMEREVAKLRLPDRHGDRWYTLREHLAAARDRLLRLRSR